MKNLMMLALAGSLTTASLAMASGTPSQLETVLKEVVLIRSLCKPA